MLRAESSSKPGGRHLQFGAVEAWFSVPQIRHLVKEHWSAGISMNAYALWCAASVLLLIHAAMIRDLVFLFVQIINLTAILAIVICVRKYERQMCLTYLHEAQTKQR